MSLFPAYAQNSGENHGEATVASVQETRANSNLEESRENSNISPAREISNISPSLEEQLLNSDNDEERLNVIKPGSRRPSLHDKNEFYMDPDFDYGNLKVSTLYYPGRPMYDSNKRRAVGIGPTFSTKPLWRPRYFESPADDPPNTHDELTERIRAFRQMLAEKPTDEALWLRFIEFQERYRDAEAALAVADEAAKRVGYNSERVRAELHRLRARVLQPHQYLDVIRTEINERAQQNAALAVELWLRLLNAVAARGDGGELDAAIAAALSATRGVPTAYPHILYIYGGYLRSAGLWEKLVLLIELVTSMNFGQGVFPPPPNPELVERVERELQETEDKVINSNLPLSTVWVRVERARAAAHWRAGAPGSLDTDPQRVPLAADVAELLLPAQTPAAQHLLLVNVLRLAKVPLLPCSDYMLRSVNASNDAAGDGWWASCGESLLALVRAARRLSPAHAARARPGDAARALAHLCDPPHYFNDDTGYLSWVRSLWEACCQWTTGAARVALVCWRLRWLHSLLLLGDLNKIKPLGTHSRLIRTEARAVLKTWAGNSPLVFAQFARLERASGGVLAARRAALKTLRAALQDTAAPPCQRLYVARVATEICDETDSHSGTWATVCAVLGVPLPADERLPEGPPKDMILEASRKCEEKCNELEAALNAGEEEDNEVAGLLSGMLPSDAEWAAARARISSAARRAELLQRVVSAATAPLAPAAQRYWEHSACALVVASAREHRMALTARAVAPLFPHNALLTLVRSDGHQWLWDMSADRSQLTRAAHFNLRTHVGALVHLLPSLLSASASDWNPADASKVVSVCIRAARGGAGGALLSVARLEAEARAARARPAPALLAALADHPHHKWLYVRGAAWCAAEAESLADVLLERALRTHALRDELVPPLPQ